MSLQPHPEYLPPSIRSLADEIGLPAALRLVERFGGTRLSVPQTMRPAHPLAQLLGAEAAERLSMYHGGREHFDLPRCHRALLRARDEQLVCDFLRGISYRQLALNYALTERGVRKIIARAGVTADDRQPELF